MYKYLWYDTMLPKDICDKVCEELRASESKLQNASVHGKEASHVRSNQNLWIPSSHWISGFCHHYVNLANEDNFKYNLNAGYEDHIIQYSLYKPDCFYKWHTDYYQREGSVRKLSFSLQLSNYDEYKGGDLQMIDEENRMYLAPKKRGSIIIFDSRIRHRVRKVTEGERRSLVGWITGPDWK
tara:strand:+ start:2669 stop:3214 length:546 start_codon:yes stop_codon:yes gene_type:complete